MSDLSLTPHFPFSSPLFASPGVYPRWCTRGTWSNSSTITLLFCLDNTCVLCPRALGMGDRGLGFQVSFFRCRSTWRERSDLGALVDNVDLGRDCWSPSAFELILFSLFGLDGVFLIMQVAVLSRLGAVLVDWPTPSFLAVARRISL